ncbi:hypothetical protein [Sandaracinus amylolyticus]|uniref:hypothetical protein n=1 Tax=Sandaracinus amylolyticus TaxID=927083 RepID=UPI001F4500B1|nr:hypothetical protein [Sandaracinus amylolyticus]
MTTQESFHGRVRRIRELRDPIALVREALADSRVFKFVVASLDECEPNEHAARLVVEAHDRGEAPSWLAAALLGHVRHRVGYAKVMEILRRGDALLSESYAAGSAALIAGAAAERDLMEVVDTVEDGYARRAAAHALGTIGTVTAIAFLAGAPARGRLRCASVAHALATAPVETRTMLEAMRSPDLETRRWPPMLIAQRLRSAAREDAARPAVPDDPELRNALASVLEEGVGAEGVVWRADAQVIRDWLANAGPYG